MRSRIGWRHHLAGATAGGCLLLAACGIGNNSDEMPGFNDQAAQAGRAPGSAAPGGAASPEAVASGTMSRSEDQLAAQAQASDTQGTGGAGTGSMEATAAAPMSDNTIFATLASANKAEIDAGNIARGQAADPSVRAFATDMIREHTAMQRQAEQLAAKLSLAPQPLANDTIQARASATQTTLGAARGAAFDRAYMRTQVEDHANTLRMLQAAERAAANPELKSFIRGAIPNVEQHLTRARDIQGKLGGGT
jgi:putative membrane protein